MRTKKREAEFIDGKLVEQVIEASKCRVIKCDLYYYFEDQCGNLFFRVRYYDAGSPFRRGEYLINGEWIEV